MFSRNLHSSFSPRRLLLAGIIASTTVTTTSLWAARETPEEKKQRYNSYVTTYQKLAGERLWLFRSSVNPALTNPNLADGLDDLVLVSEYLEQSMELPGTRADQEKNAQAFQKLEHNTEQFRILYNLMQALGDQGYPGLELPPQDVDMANSALQRAKDALNRLDTEIPQLKQQFH
ncbi:hypothetical protein [Parendozoicomonas haliclonae]|uniref:Uncharacterized protein n=1 Tax=Parendozoicomonas haliclonae TaxID=1960125 RepID=A0A1X7AK31_9GAMM|nr:hypothetical protein [Parendozoicomonas haliclonae]SMA47430.1 hypothetical protein EHSB41UT_02414 [Parendozoicomonas haliclonae]